VTHFTQVLALVHWSQLAIQLVHWLLL